MSPREMLVGLGSLDPGLLDRLDADLGRVETSLLDGIVCEYPCVTEASRHLAAAGGKRPTTTLPCGAASVVQCIADPRDSKKSSRGLRGSRRHSKGEGSALTSSTCRYTESSASRRTTRVGLVWPAQGSGAAGGALASQAGG